MDKWRWTKEDPETSAQIRHGISNLPDQEQQELRALQQSVGLQGMQGIAAIRAWTEEDLHLHKVLTTVSRMATSKQCLQKILPLLRLLYEGLCLLPERYVFCSRGALYRGEKFIREEFRKHLQPGDRFASVHFTSFTTDRAVAADFKHSSFLHESALVQLDEGLIPADPIPTLEDRLRKFFWRFACDFCLKDEDKQLEERAGFIAQCYTDNVRKLKRMLKKRFNKTLQDLETPERTILTVQDGVGYQLRNLSVLPEEAEVLMEPGALLQVVEDNRTELAHVGEEETKRLMLKTVIVRGEALLTERLGEPFTSTAKRKEDEACVRRQVNQEMQEITAALSGDDLAAAAETLKELRRMLLGGSGPPVRAKGAKTQRTRSAKGSAARSVPETAAGEEQKVQVLLQQLKDEVHNFDGACDWLMQITVRQHDGNDEEDGERVQPCKTRTARDYRLYSVDAGRQIRVTVRNLSLTRSISFVPVYLGEDGNEEGEEPVDLKSGEAHELPYPLTKEVGDAEDGWLLRDKRGKTLLKVRFAVQPS